MLHRYRYLVGTKVRCGEGVFQIKDMHKTAFLILVVWRINFLLCYRQERNLR